MSAAGDLASDATALFTDPDYVAKVRVERIPSLLCWLGALQSALAARLVGASPQLSSAGQEPHGDQLLDVDEAAKRLATSADWLYRHATKLPFTVRLGPRQLRFSAAGIGRWIQRRGG